MVFESLDSQCPESCICAHVSGQAPTEVSLARLLSGDGSILPMARLSSLDRAYLDFRCTNAVRTFSTGLFTIYLQTNVIIDSSYLNHAMHFLQLYKQCNTELRLRNLTSNYSNANCELKLPTAIFIASNC
jgi:hypothetical protein